MSEVRPTLLERVLESENPAEELTVHISYQIIKLFSEGLYKSPHKAVEELVSNSYDAGATRAHVVMNTHSPTSSLWVLDNGTGMNLAGFRRLWTIAKSQKADFEPAEGGRAPIGQFGIGKLAAYVLARHLTHVSKSNEGFLFTSMDFSEVSRKDIEDSQPLQLSLNRVTEPEARGLLEELTGRYPDLEERLFGPRAWVSWTAAALSSFKDLGEQLKEGILKWVLRTGLPVASEFQVFVNGDQLKPAQENREPIAELGIGGIVDKRAQELKLEVCDDGVLIEGVGKISGKARIYKNPLSGSKASEQYHRNNGLFVFVRKRVINLEDELFGLDTQNHAAWSRFYMEVHADGLRQLLLSSREGVRETEAVVTLRKYMHKTFLHCRVLFEKTKAKKLKDLDVQALLEQAPSLLLTEPLTDAVMDQALAGGERFKYIRTPAPLASDRSWVEEFEGKASEEPFSSVSLVQNGPYSNIADYDAATRSLSVNREHPFIVKILDGASSESPAKIVGAAEVVTEALLHSVGVLPEIAWEFLDKRDEVTRLLAGQYPAAASDALRFLDSANENDTAMERAVGAAFEVLGFHYEQRGENRGGTDGVLTARLGRDNEGMRTYRVVFDAKTTKKATVPAAKLGWQALARFAEDESAQFGFFLAKGYQGQDDPSSAVNREAQLAGKSLLTIGDLKDLIDLHVRHGTTLLEIRRLFEEGTDRRSVKAWLEAYRTDLSSPENNVPILDLLQALEEQKDDDGAVPDVNVARYTKASLKGFQEDKLLAKLRGLEKIVSQRFIEVDEQRRKVRMHQTPEKLVREVQRVLSLSTEELTEE